MVFKKLCLPDKYAPLHGSEPGCLAANPPAVLSPARNSHHHHQLSALANNRFLPEQENVLKIFDIREQPLVINIPRKPVAACNLGLHWSRTPPSFCKEYFLAEGLWLHANYSLRKMVNIIFINWWRWQVQVWSVTTSPGGRLMSHHGPMPALSTKSLVPSYQQSENRKPDKLWITVSKVTYYVIHA